MDKKVNNQPSLKNFLPDVSDGYTAYAGEKILNFNNKLVSKDEIIKVLEKIKDPEIPVNIYELGLIYDIIIKKGGNVDITMSLTAPNCPVAGELPKEVANKVSILKNVGLVTVNLVWEPSWTPDRMSEDAKMALDYDF